MDRRVTVLLPNARRHNVNVSANTTLLQILETACEKHGFDSDEYCLKFHNKEVSLSQMFRFSGLPNNCVLEMERMERKRSSASKVIVCVQLENGRREQDEFPATSNLWNVVEKLCNEQASKFESPVCIYMRSEVIGKERMQQTTLKSLGITEGRAMLRFSDKKPEELKQQANVYKPAVVQPKSINEKNDDDERPSTSRNVTAGAAKSGGFALSTDMVKSLKRNAATEENQNNETESTEANETKTTKSEETEKPKYDWGTGSGYSMHKPQVPTENIDDEMEQEIEPPIVHIIGQRQAVAFSLDASIKQVDDLPDSFFDLTVNDLKMVLRDLKRTASGTESAPMLTAKLRELERQKTMLNKLNQYKDCVLRIHFPDRHVLQGIFKPHEQFAKVEEFVREFLAYPNESFELFTIPPKNVLPSNETLLELNFVPNAVIHFAYKEKETTAKNKYLQEKYLEQLTSEDGAHYAVQKYRLSKVNTTS